MLFKILSVRNSLRITLKAIILYMTDIEIFNYYNDYDSIRFALGIICILYRFRKIIIIHIS